MTCLQRRNEALQTSAAYQMPSTLMLIVEQVSGDCGSDADPGLPLPPALLPQTAGALVSHWIIGVPDPGRQPD